MAAARPGQTGKTKEKRHESLWAMNWTREGAETAIGQAKKYELDFIEIA